MADLTKLKPQERQILLIVGPSSVVWRLDDLSKELLDHGIRSLIDPVDLIDYFDKRPTLFTVVNNHVWSKVAPRKMPQNQVPQKLVKIPDEKENTIKTASHSNNDDATIDVKKDNTDEWPSKKESKPNFQNRMYFSNSNSKSPSPASSRSSYVTPPRFSNENKKREFERIPSEKSYTPRWNSILMPSNAMFNPVANLIHNCPHNPENSVRICIESRRYIMYKVDWVFSKLPSHIKKNWKSVKELMDDLFYDQDFFIGPHCCHMKAALQRNPHPDKMARVLVDKLLDQNGSMSSKDLYNILPNKFKLYLKTAKGLKGFVQFYPALFQTEEETTDDKIELMAVPIFKSEKDLKLPHGFDPKKAEDAHQMVINSVLNLMKLSHMDAQNSTVFVFANVDKPYYKLEWIYEKLPRNIKSKFDGSKSLKTFLFRNSRTFLIIGGFVQIRTKLVDVPCDKSISLEILRVQHRNSSATVQDILHQLPSYCSSRVRSVAELQKFMAIYPEFHGKTELPNSQQYGAVSKTSSPADLRQNTE